MAFQIKDFTSIVASMINYMRGTQQQVTDFNVGSVARTMVEAPAVEIDELYQQMFNGITEAIPVATYNSFSFTRIAAIAASGRVTVTIAQQDDDVLIAAGTIFTLVDGATSYQSLVDVTIAEGDTTATFRIAASQAGALGNIPANTVFTMTPSPNGFVSAINAASFANGEDEETDDQRKARFADYIATLQRGTLAAIIYGAKTTTRVTNGVIVEQIRAAALIEPYVADNTQPTGLVELYVHNGVGSTSGDIVAACQEIVDGYYDEDGDPVPGWKAAGVVVEVVAADEVEVDFTAAMTVAVGYDEDELADEAAGAIADYILNLDIGKPFIRAEAISLAMDIEGVTDFIPSVPSGNVTATNSEKLMPGTITIT